MTPAKSEEVGIRTLRADDIPFAMELKNLAGWNQVPDDWAGYASYEPAGCFVAEMCGRRLGTATTICYGDCFGWIGMVLVHPDARRLGIGTKLLRRAIDYLRDRGVKSLKLDATPTGRTVYVPMGFKEEYDISRYLGRASEITGLADPSVRLVGERDLPELVGWDSTVFGAERERVLRSLSSRNPELSFVRREGGRIVGYLMARRGQNAVQAGPWIAEDMIGAGELWRAFLKRVPGERVFVDVPHPNAAGRALMEGAGFTVQRGFTRMYLGENIHPGRPERVFATSSPEKG